MKGALTGIRGKLILIFVIIKVVPLLILAWVAWSAAQRQGDSITANATQLADGMLGSVRQIGERVTNDSIRALDERSREQMERLTTDTARAVANFLYDRDVDIRHAAQVPPEESAYRRFLSQRQRLVHRHGPWRMAPDGSRWEPVRPVGPDPALAARASEALPDNARNFHARPPEYLGERHMQPLFVEMNFIDLDGHERIKVVNGELMSPQLKDISKRGNTFVRAESYWPELRKLKPGDIYVSNLVGAYVGSRIIGSYTLAATQKAGIPFEPEKSAYAGTENPVGRRFRGIIRWATPVVRDGAVTGYVTLALDHEHLRQFTDRIMPTDARYTPIIDAIAGNYAFMWDQVGRALAHPRDYMIPGYDPATGNPVAPWMDQGLYDEWQESGKPAYEFLRKVPPYRNQSLKLQPAAAQVRAGTLGLDCRYLNFSPQCAGWHQLTEQGGSGSFKIYFSGLWKLTTAATIPYYTGQYGASPRGFGYVTIGANVDDFHRSASESARQIAQTISDKGREFDEARRSIIDDIADNLTRTTTALLGSTLVMIVLVIVIAFWMAHFLSTRITSMIDGIRRFQSGELSHRLEVRSRDEMGQLALAFNNMADSVEESLHRSDAARLKAEESNQVKTDFLARVSHELRTPLNGILGFAELLEMELSDEAQRDYARTIKSSGHHLLDIVNDLLDLAKVEAGKVELHPEGLRLEYFCNEVVELHRGHAQSRGLDMRLELMPDLPAEICADPLRLTQILNNLLNNAIKFTDTGSVTLRVSAEGNGIAFAVIDTGRGIPEHLQEAVFDKFRQADAALRRAQGGTGLGLALARQLAELMGGRITLISAPGEGASFTLWIPADARQS